jgi:hypothetical protein
MNADELNIRIKAGLIRGLAPDEIADELERAGVGKALIEQVFAANAEMLEKSRRYRRQKARARLVGALIFFPSMVINLYYLFFVPGVTIFTFLFWATAAYGLMAMLLGQLDTFFVMIERDRHD